MNEIYKRMGASGVVPVICIPDPQYAVPLAGALIAGGVPAIEVTLRNDTACDSIALIREAYPEMLIAAGTVRTVRQMELALRAGAEIMVAPGLNRSVQAACAHANVCYLPACVTGTEIEMGLEMGLDTFKFYPCEQFGGISSIRLLSGPYPEIRFVPTGGLSLTNIAEYLACPAVLACGGSFMAKSEWILSKNWIGITESCRECVRIAQACRAGEI